MKILGHLVRVEGGFLALVLEQLGARNAGRLEVRGQMNVDGRRHGNDELARWVELGVEADGGMAVAGWMKYAL